MIQGLLRIHYDIFPVFVILGGGWLYALYEGRFVDFSEPGFLEERVGARINRVIVEFGLLVSH